MINFKSKQIFLAVCLLTSLFVGTVSACVCSHHASEPEKLETETPSCHYQAKEKEAQEAEIQADYFESGENCVCAAISQRTATKSEAIKFKKLAAAITPNALFTVVTQEQPIVTSLAFVSKPFFLSDSFYNIAPKRGPPRS